MECVLCGPSVGWNLVIRGWWWPLTILISIISTWYQYDICMVLVIYLKDITSWGSKIILGAIQKKCATFLNMRKLELWWPPLTKIGKKVKLTLFEMVASPLPQSLARFSSKSWPQKLLSSLNHAWQFELSFCLDCSQSQQLLNWSQGHLVTL